MVKLFFVCVLVMVFSLSCFGEDIGYNPFPNNWSESWSSYSGDSLYIPSEQELLELCEAISERCKATWPSHQTFSGYKTEEVYFPEMSYIRSNYFGIIGTSESWSIITNGKQNLNSLFNLIVNTTMSLSEHFTPLNININTNMNRPVPKWEENWYDMNGSFWQDNFPSNVWMAKNPIPPLMSQHGVLKEIGVTNIYFITNNVPAPYINHDKRVLCGFPISEEPYNNIIAQWNWQTNVYLTNVNQDLNGLWIGNDTFTNFVDDLIGWWGGSWNKYGWILYTNAYDFSSFSKDPIKIYFQSTKSVPINMRIDYLYLDKNPPLYDTYLSESGSPVLFFYPYSFHEESSIWRIANSSEMISLPWTSDKIIVAITNAVILPASEPPYASTIVAVYSNCLSYGNESFAFGPNPSQDWYLTWSEMLKIKEILLKMKEIVVYKPNFIKKQNYMVSSYENWCAQNDPPNENEYKNTISVPEWGEPEYTWPDNQLSFDGTSSYDGMLEVGRSSRSQGSLPYFGAECSHPPYLRIYSGLTMQTDIFKGVFIEIISSHRGGQETLIVDPSSTNRPCILKLYATSSAYCTTNGARSGLKWGDGIFKEVFSEVPSWIELNDIYGYSYKYYGIKDTPILDYSSDISEHAGDCGYDTRFFDNDGPHGSETWYIGIICTLEYDFKFK